MKKILLLPVLMAGTLFAQNPFESYRPNRTELAYTIPAGHFQWDSDLVSFKKTSSDPSATSYGLAVSNLKFGLNNWIDIQVMAETFFKDEINSQGRAQTNTEFGDLSLRMNMNVYGREKSDVHISVMPYVALPVFSQKGDGNKSEAGVIFPVVVPFLYRSLLRADFATGFIRTQSDDLSVKITGSLEVSHKITTQIETYIGIASQRKTSAMENIMPNFSFGGVYSFTDTLLLDGGLNLEMNGYATPFIGISARY